jgi:hypothetical protein
MQVRLLPRLLGAMAISLVILLIAMGAGVRPVHGAMFSAFWPLMLLPAMAIISYIIDTVSWNKGQCKTCQTALRHFDMDSQGGNGYICDSCHHTVWI